MLTSILAVLLLTGALEQPVVPEPDPIQLGYIPREAATGMSRKLAVTPSSPIEIRLRDRRAGGDARAIGTLLRRDATSGRLSSSNAVLPLIETALVRNAEILAVPLLRGSDLILSGRLLVFNLTVFDQGPRVRYTGNVRVAFELRQRDGAILWSGMAQGDATQTSPGFAPRRCNEVFSIAMIGAFTRMFGDPELNRAWSGHPAEKSDAARPARNPPVTPAELLAEIQGLQKSGADREAVADHVRRRRLSTPLGVDEIAAWTRAGIPRTLLGLALSCEVAEYKK